MSLEKLAADHAHWADEVQKLYRKAREIYCSHHEGQSCISLAFYKTRDYIAENHDPGDLISYQEVWEEMDSHGEICHECKQLRELKKQRMYARRRLGVIRGAITRVGRKIHKPGETDDITR